MTAGDMTAGDMNPGDMTAGDMTAGDTWERVRHRRLALADRIDALSPEQWDSDSWCSGWRTRDVLGHLVHLAESTQLSMARDIIGHGARPDPALRRIARRMGDVAVPELTERLRRSAGGRFHVLGTPRAVVLGEILTHGEDALRPLGLSIEPPPGDVYPVLEVYRRIGRLVFHAPSSGDVRLVATDIDWSTGRGPEVRGKAIDILLLLANRRPVLSTLTGPGLPALER